MEANHTVIKPSNLSYGQQLAQIDPHSAFGIVYKGKYNNNDVAIKKTRLQGENDYFLISTWADECRKLERLQDVNIARFLGVVEEKGNWAIVQEWIDGQDLHAVMKSYPDGAPNDFAGRIGQQIAEGLSYLHVNHIVHLNVSPGNVIFNSSRSSLKLRDYGLRTFKMANFAKEPTHGNPRYVAVEVMMRQHDQINPASDVWSWGMVMWEVLTGSTVFSAFRPPQISRKVWEAGDRPDLEDVSDASFRQLLAQCWNKSSGSRPSVQTLISSSQQLSGRPGKSHAHDNNPGLFSSGPAPSHQHQHAAPAPAAAAAASKSNVDASLDDMLSDLDKLL